MKKKKCLKCGYWNAADAAYCNLCYEPFNKARVSAAPAAPPLLALPEEAPGPKKRLTEKLLLGAFLFLLAVAASVRFYNPRGGGPGAAAPVNRYAEKSAEADRLLDSYILSKTALLAEIGGKPDPEGFGLTGQYTRKLFEIEDNYEAAVRALDLPCRSCVDKGADAGYLKWEEAHGARENAAMEDFNGKYQALIQRAGAGSRP